MRGRFILGWAHDPQHPADRVELDVHLDGQPLGRHRADVERSDLVRAGIGDGRHAFRIELPELLEPGSAHTLIVRAVADSAVIPLARDYFADMTGTPGAAPLVLSVNGTTPEPAEEPEGPVVPVLDPPDELAFEELTGPAPQRPRALAGASGWLFAFDSRERLSASLGLTRNTAERVAAQVRTLRERDERLRSLGVGYVVVTVPEKTSVYFDRLPPGLRLDRESRPAAELAAALREDPRLELLDLLGPLLDARRHGRAFLRQGLSLTWTGAYHAYRAIAKELAKRFPAVEPVASAGLLLGGLVENAELLPHRERVTLMGRELVPVLPANEEPDVEPELVRDGFEAMFVPVPDSLAGQLGPAATLLELSPGSNLPTAVIVHDGSGERLVPFLAEHFARTVVEVGDGLPDPLIAAERPLVVVQIIGEAGRFFA